MTSLISFKITERPDLHLRPFAVEGTEGLSQLYKFDIDCFGDIAKRPDTLDMIGKRAVLRFELEGAAPREVFGIIKTITSGAPSMYGDARYRFQLVPWLERLNYSRASQIHGTNKEVSVVDVLEAELRGGLRRETRVADTHFRIFEHELRLKNRDSYAPA
jgi:type VI secretion system secreted protein VgrG